MLLKNQSDISSYRAMPIEDVTDASKIITVTDDATVQLYYYNAGVLTIDAGQLAGVYVVAQLKNRNILNALGSGHANKNNTSLTFTSTALTTEVEFPWQRLEQSFEATAANLLTVIAEVLTANGYYTVDYRTGTIYGRKASNQVTLTSTSYKVATTTIGNVITGGGTAGGGFQLYILDSLNSFSQGSTAYTAATQFTIAGYSFSVNPKLIDRIERYNSSNAYQESITPKTHIITEAAGVFTVTGMSASAGDLFVLYILGLERTVDNTINSQMVITQNPRTALSESIVDTTNVAAATNYYPSATGKEFGNREDLSFTGKMVDADGTMTLSLQGTNDEDTTNADWQDVYFYDAINKAVVNTITITNGTVYINGHADKFNMVYYRYKMVNGGATNTMIIKERAW